MPALAADRARWEERGSNGSELNNHLVSCRWESACSRRYWAKNAAAQAATAARRAADNAAGIGVPPGEPIDLDDLSADTTPQHATAGTQFALW